MGADAPDSPPPESIHLTDIPDRVAAEALALEVRRLARRHGLEVSDLRVRRADPDAPSDTGSA
jgi:hypothetical protein